MNSSVRFLILGVIVGACAAGVVAYCCRLVTEPISATTEPSNTDVALITERLDKLQAMFQDTDGISRSGIMPVSRVALDDDKNIRNILDAIAVTVNRVASILEATEGVENAPSNAPIPKNDVALADMLKNLKSDNSAIQQRHFAWTPIAVYRQYGYPTNSYRDKNLVVWDYSVGGDRMIRFEFSMGIVHTAQYR